MDRCLNGVTLYIGLKRLAYSRIDLSLCCSVSLHLKGTWESQNHQTFCALGRHEGSIFVSGLVLEWTLGLKRLAYSRIDLSLCCSVSVNLKGTYGRLRTTRHFV